MKLSVKGFALACGVLWGVVLFLWTLLNVLTTAEWGTQMLNLFVGFYPFYDLTVAGAFIGLVAGFIDGLVCGTVFAWLYNKLSV